MLLDRVSDRFDQTLWNGGPEMNGSGRLRRRNGLQRVRFQIAADAAMLDGQAGVRAARWYAVDAAGRNQTGGWGMMMMVVVIRLLLVLSGYSIGGVDVVCLDLGSC